MIITIIMIMTEGQREGGIHDSGNYRGIKMISHTVTIWERSIDRRLREETREEQFGLMPGGVIFFPTLVPGSVNVQLSRLAGLGYWLGLGFWVVITIIVSLTLTITLITTLTVILP